MRRILSFDCEGSRLAGTLDDAAGQTGLLIVSGGNEIRIGAHRGMAKLAADIAAAGHPVLRFDRRGIGDSDGENGGFEASRPDIAAAIAAFRAECPALTRVVAFGNCDAASALALHRPDGIDALVITNPWVIERVDDLPPTAAIRAHYLERLRDLRAWLGLFKGAVDLEKLLAGIAKIAQRPQSSTLAGSVASGLTAFEGPIAVLLSKKDGTAIAFAEEWDKPRFTRARGKANLTIEQLDSASHSFASEQDYQALKRVVMTALDQ